MNNFMTNVDCENLPRKSTKRSRNLIENAFINFHLVLKLAAKRLEIEWKLCYFDSRRIDNSNDGEKLLNSADVASGEKR